MFQKLQTLWKVLKDFFYYNYLCLLGKPRYPRSILPKQNYTPLLNIDAMSKEADLFIVRRADVSCKEIFNEAGTLKDDVIRSKDVPRLSTNLLGSYYLLKHIKFRTMKNGAEPWLNRTKIHLLDFINDYEVLKKICPIIYKLNNLHNAPVPFINKKNKHSDNFIKANNLTPEIIGVEYKLKGKIKIVHEPTNLNYWHVELKLYDALDTEVTRKDDNAWARSSKRYVLEHFLSVPMFETPKNIQAINKSYYVIK